jgi:ketosteroid isomerase-like protein
MSEENVELVRSVYERYSRGDFRAAADLFDPHVVLVLDPVFAASLISSPVDDAFYGIEAVATFTRDMIRDAHVTMGAEDIVAVGDSVLVSVHQRVTGKISGVPTEARYFSIWSFQGGKVIRIESFGGRAEALQALGLGE